MVDEGGRFACGQLVFEHKQIAASDSRGIFGHSMGGYGALITALRHPGRYRSVSAFAPIAAPSQVHWGQKALSAYLGADPQAWRAWDVAELVATARQEKLHLLTLRMQPEGSEY